MSLLLIFSVFHRKLMIPALLYFLRNLLIYWNCWNHWPDKDCYMGWNKWLLKGFRCREYAACGRTSYIISMINCCFMFATTIDMSRKKVSFFNASFRCVICSYQCCIVTVFPGCSNSLWFFLNSIECWEKLFVFHPSRFYLH